MSNRYRWTLSLDDGATWPHEVRPINGSKIGLQQKRNLDKGEAFFRTSLSTRLSLGGDAYQLLWNLERRSSKRCLQILVRLEMKCNQVFSELWRGSFSPGACEYEVSKCLVNVTPETVDPYACLLSSQKVRRNVLSLDPHPVSGVEPSRLQIRLTTNPGAFTGAYTTATSFPDPRGNGCTIYVMWKEVIVTACTGGIGGTPTAPTTPGWTLTGNSCAISGFAQYERSPGFSWTSGVPVAGTMDGITPVPPDDSCDWIHLLTDDLPNGDVVGCYDGVTITDPNLPYFICPPLPVGIANTVTLPQARRFDEVLELMTSECGLGVVSDFFEINPAGDAPGYVAGDNYIKGGANQLANQYLVDITDALFPGATNPASFEYLTFEELMTALYVKFRVLWDIDSSGNLRIEHWHYWTFQVGLDLTITDPKQTIEPQTFKHLGEVIPRIERARLMEAQSTDFVGQDILYDSPCAKNEEVKEWSVSKVMTDWPMILESYSDQYTLNKLPKEGFLLVACDSTDTMIVEDGAITQTALGNAPLAIANLMRDYWTWDRYLRDGNMNGADTVFDGFLPNIEQSKVRLTMCCELFQFDPKKQVRSKLTTHLGVNAEVSETSYELMTNRLEMTLKYAY